MRYSAKRILSPIYTIVTNVLVLETNALKARVQNSASTATHLGTSDFQALLLSKGGERARRAAPGLVRVKINHRDQKLPTWKKFLAVSDYKTALVEFLLSEWKSPNHVSRFHDRSLYVCRVELLQAVQQ